MAADRWQRVKDVFSAALERPAAERSAYLTEACGDDAGLRREVESLLASHDEAGEFLAEPAIPAAAERSAARQVGPYRILDEIGRGGMGVVYRAVRDDDAFKKTVALKIIQAGSPEHVERRFRQERQILAGLEHPNIAAIFDGGSTEEGRLYLVMEYVLGEPITRYCETRGLDTRRRLEIFRTACEAVHHAHQNFVVHRDLKPGNILVTADGTPKLLDFGIAKLISGVDAQTPPTATMQPVMTPEYASPEQVKGETVTAASDVYSLGIVLYELLAGQRPYEVKADSLEAIVRVVCDTDPQAPSAMGAGAASELRGDLDTIVLKALRKEPRDRYASVDQLSDDIRRHLDGLPIAARPDTLTYRTAKFMRRNSTAVAAAVASLLLVAVALLGRDVLQQRAPVAGQGIDSVAVLPLLNPNADPSTEYLGEGITEGIISSLSQLPRLKVMALSTTFRYKGAKADAREIGRDLKVRAVLAGRVVQQGDSLNIGVELVDTLDGSRIWGAQYRRSLDDLPALHGDIAREIADKLRLQLTGAERQRLAKRHTQNAAANELYLRGRYFWNKRTSEDLRRGIGYFEQAIDKDPRYALAYSGLADCYNLLAVFSELPAEDAYSRARVAALKALELDDTLAEAHTSLASVRLRHEWDWAAAESEFRRAIELNPGYPTARYWYALYLAEVGQLDRAVAQVRLAQEVDPLSLTTNYHVGVVLYYARRYDEAIEQLKKTLELEPNFVQGHRYLALVYEQKGMYQEARESIQKAVALSGDSPLMAAFLGHVQAVSGRREDARKTARALSERKDASAYNVAAVYAALADNERAFAWLERAYQERSSWLTLLKADPRLDGLRRDPRFANLMQRLGLTP